MPAALVVGGAGIVSGLLGASAAKSAAKTQAAAANNAANMSFGMFNTIRGDLSDYRGVGSAAAPAYMRLVGLGGSVQQQGAGGPNWDNYLKDNPDVYSSYQQYANGPEFQLGGGNTPPGLTPQQFAQHHYEVAGQFEGRKAPAVMAATNPSADIQAALESLPGYQFARDQGLKAVTSSLSARGLGGGSGAFGKGLARFVTGLADQTYGEQVKRLGDAVGVGQSAANQTGAYGQAAATNAGNAMVGGANASAAGSLGSAQAIGQGLQSGAQGYLTSQVLGMYKPSLSQVASQTIANNPLLFG